MTKLWNYHVSYNRRGHSLRRRFYQIVAATDADDARRVAAARDPLFRLDPEGKPTTVRTPRRMGEVPPPEANDGLTAAKAREFVEWRGTSVEVVDG
jgi:hypothetical protein